jgi:hypothetical protein
MCKGVNLQRLCDDDDADNPTKPRMIIQNNPVGHHTGEFCISVDASESAS